MVEVTPHVDGRSPRARRWVHRLRLTLLAYAVGAVVLIGVPVALGLHGAVAAEDGAETGAGALVVLNRAQPFGDLRVGDRLLDDDGRVVRVVATVDAGVRLDTGEVVRAADDPTVTQVLASVPRVGALLGALTALLPAAVALLLLWVVSGRLHAPRAGREDRPPHPPLARVGRVEGAGWVS